MKVKRLFPVMAALGLVLSPVACVKHHDASEALERARAADSERELESIIIDAQRAIDSEVATLDDMRIHKLDEAPGLLGSIRNHKFATHPEARPVIRSIIRRVIAQADAQIVASRRLGHLEVLARAERTKERAEETLSLMANEDAREADEAKRLEVLRQADRARQAL